MSYMMAITKAGNTIITEKYYSSRYNKKGIERSVNLHKTTEAQEKCNLRKAVRKVTILMNANFKGGDWHLVLDYSPDNRPATPRGSQKEHKTIHGKDQTTVPEGWHRDEVYRGCRVWKKWWTASSSGDEYLHRRNGRNEKQVAVWSSTLQSFG